MISVILPAYNSSRFIGKAIESITNQTFSEFELIIVDDGSSDNTLRLAFDWARRDSRLRVIKTDHGGPSRALNRGIAAARYNWLAIMNDDDISLPQRLENQLKATRRSPGVVAWGSYAYHLSATGRILGLSKAGPTSEEEFHKTRERGDVFTIIHPTALLKKDVVLRAGGYDPAFDTAQDMDLFDRMADYGPIVTIPEPLVLYRIHASADTMARFPRQRALVRYLRARRRAKTTGQQVLTLGEFTDQQSHRPVLYRSRIWLDDMSQYYYRCAGVAYADCKYNSAFWYMAVSTTLNPWQALHRVWQQRVSRNARHWLRPGSFGTARNGAV